MKTAQFASNAPRPVRGFFLILGFAVFLAVTNIAESLDLTLLDNLHRLLAERFPKAVRTPVVIVGIDDATMQSYPEPLALWHAHLGKFFKAMAVAKPSVVGVDLVLPSRSFDALVPGLDHKLLEGLAAARASTRIVLGLTTDGDGMPREIHAPFLAMLPKDAIGYVLLPIDSDNVVRRFNERLGRDGQNVPTLVGQMARALGVVPVAGWIDYAYGAQKEYIPLPEVERWLATGNVARLQAAFGGRPVLIGNVARFEDRLHQPVNLAGWEAGNGRSVSGVLVQAQILKAMLNGGLLRSTPTWLTILVTLFAALCWFLPLRLPGTIAAITLAWLGLYAGAGLALHAGIVIPVAAVMITVAVAFGGRWLFTTLADLRERRRLREVFGGYVSPQLMQEILAGRMSGDLEPDVRIVTIMFVDLRGFTRLSESMAPRDVIAILNRYFEHVADAIHSEGGTLNSIMGDGLMAIFGAPKPMNNSCKPAFAAARAILTLMPSLNAELEREGKPALAVGIGLNVGEAVVGNVGSKTRHDYSAIGDTTNVASRLEGLTKVLGTPLVCARAVAQSLGFPPELVSLGAQSISGHAPVDVYGWREASVK